MARRVGERPLAVGAGVIVALEALLGSAGASAPLLSVAALVLAPGLALAPLLPERVRESSLSVLAAAPVLGLRGELGPADHARQPRHHARRNRDPARARRAGRGRPRSCPGRKRHGRSPRTDWPVAAGLALALGLGALLQQRVIGGNPVPGNDWAKYLLYGDEIAAHGHLLITNPFWMLGVPFREDPGVPALYGSFLSLSGEPASTLSHGIWVFAIVSILAVYTFTRAFWGDLAGVIAAGLWAVLPISQDILALARRAQPGGDLPPRADPRLHLGADRRRARRRRGRGAWPAAGRPRGGSPAERTRGRHGHSRGARLEPHCGGAARPAARSCAAAASPASPRSSSAPVSSTTWSSARGRFGGTQDYRAYLSAKVNLGPVVSDLSVIFTVLAVAALVFAVRLATRDRAVAVLLSLLAVMIALAYSWVFEIPTAYFRMAYYLPLALVPLVAAGARAAADAPPRRDRRRASPRWRSPALPGRRRPTCATSTRSRTPPRCAASTR